MVKGLLCSVKLGAVLTCSCRFFFPPRMVHELKKKVSSAWHMPMAFSVNISLHDIWMCYTMYAFLSLSLCEMRVILSSFFFLRCFGWKVFNWGKGLLLRMYLFSVYLCCWYATLFFFFFAPILPRHREWVLTGLHAMISLSSWHWSPG